MDIEAWYANLVWLLTLLSPSNIRSHHASSTQLMLMLYFGARNGMAVFCFDHNFMPARSAQSAGLLCGIWSCCYKLGTSVCNIFCHEGMVCLTSIAELGEPGTDLWFGDHCRLHNASQARYAAPTSLCDMFGLLMLGKPLSNAHQAVHQYSCQDWRGLDNLKVHSTRY